MTSAEHHALMCLRDVLQQHRRELLQATGQVPESVLSIWNLTRWYLGEVTGPVPQPMSVPTKMSETTPSCAASSASR